MFYPHWPFFSFPPPNSYWLPSPSIFGPHPRIDFCTVNRGDQSSETLVILWDFRLSWQWVWRWQLSGV
jgi:hypothetical protein